MSEPGHPPPSAGVDRRDHVDRPPDDEAAASVRVVDKRWWAREARDDAGTETGGTTRPAYVAELERRLADQEALVAEYAAKYRQSSQEFEQTRERLRREAARDVVRETRAVLASFLDVVDNLDRAMAAGAHDTGSPAALLQGVALVRDQLLATLAAHGVTRLEADGAPFDPNLHDALTMVPVDDPARDNIVVTVVTPGYRVGDEVLRPATVTVGKLDA